VYEKINAVERAGASPGARPVSMLAPGADVMRIHTEIATVPPVPIAVCVGDVALAPPQRAFALLRVTDVEQSAGWPVAFPVSK
jgi:hypothetical protein